MSSRSTVLLACLLVCLCLPAAAADRAHPVPMRVELPEREADLELLLRLDIDVDGVFHGWARIYVDAEQEAKLEALGMTLTALPDEGAIGLARLREEGIARGVTRGAVPAQYHDYASLTADLQQIAADHPGIVRLSSIGQSEQGRELWMVKLSDNPDLEEDEPELLYISSMHGDEVVGKELCFNLIQRLAQDYGSDPRVTALVDGAEIWILPSLNPDGTELGQRYNANGVDLNRDFPDQFVDPVDTSQGRAAETAAVMNWHRDRRISLAANFHGGALVANYPFDSNPAGSSVFSPTPDPDHPTFVSLARTYADHNPPMSQSNSHPAFDDGITNGADWYAISGGMQDYDYVWHGGHELTVEVSNVKWPPAIELPTFWNENEESLLAYLERGLGGVRGVITDADTGLPVDARIYVDGSPYPTYTDPDLGDWHRVVVPGTYTLTVSATGYQSWVVPGVQVGGGPATRVDIQLGPQPPNLQPDGNRVEDGVAGNGWLDPGESADLALTLRNYGREATGVDAALIPTGWYGEIFRPLADFPDVAMGGSAESDVPHFGVEVLPGVPAGHKLGFAVEWHSAEGSGQSEPFFLDVGAPTCASSAAGDLPQTISYVQSAHSELTLSGVDAVSAVTVSVDVQHGYIGELEMVLTSAQGTQLTLHGGTGGSADDIVGTYGVDLTPAQPLAILDGESAAGTWELDITDSAFVNSGSLQAFGIEVCGHPAETSTPEMRFRELAREDGNARLRWWPYPGMASYRVYRATDPSSGAAFADVTGLDPDPADTSFLDGSADPLVFYLVTGVGPQGEGPKGHHGQ